MAAADLTAARLRALFNYSKITGLFTRLVTVSSRARAGQVAGCVNKNGYLVIRIDGVLHYAHRLAFLYVNGEWPSLEIDHEDTDPANNSWRNLRDVPHSVNAQNIRSAHATKKSGLPLGVFRDKRNGNLSAALSIDGKYNFIGSGYETPETAYAAYVAAKRELHAGNTL